MRKSYKKRKYNFIDDQDFIDDEEEYVNVDNYFEIDSIRLQRALIENLTNNFEITSDEIQPIVEETFKINIDSIDQYLSAKPSDISWKLGMNPKKIQKLEPKLLKLRQEIEDEKPTIEKILTYPLNKDEQKKCIKLFDRLNNLEPFTSDYSFVQDSINHILDESKNQSHKEVEYLERENERLKSITSVKYSIKNRILKLEADDNVKKTLYVKYLNMMKHEPGSTVYNSLKDEIEWVLKLPHNKGDEMNHIKTMSSKELNNYYINIMKQLDDELYGMENVKNRLLHIINDRRSSNNSCGRNIALIGPPGVGKTQIGKSLAKVLNVKFEKISVGGMDDASILKGSDKVWQGASPSIVLQILSRMKSNNGIIMWDEVDKLGGTSRGKQAQYALLHISDYEHNNEFRDNYLNDFPHDISKLWFIFCMNTKDDIDPALLDRLDIIEVKPYSLPEKKIIFRDYMLVKALKTVSIKSKEIIFTDSAINEFLREYSKSGGLRDVEKLTKTLVGRINMYKNTSINGSMGNLKLPYKIPNFRLPYKITPKILKMLLCDIN